MCKAVKMNHLVTLVCSLHQQIFQFTYLSHSSSTKEVKQGACFGAATLTATLARSDLEEILCGIA
jgi:hypothetical protein